MTRRMCLGLFFSLLWAGSLLAAEKGLVGEWRFDDVAGKKTALDGSQRFVFPSKPELNLVKGFTIETRFRAADFSNGRAIVFKDQQYSLRIDWPVEGSKLSFFVYSGQQWEPRVSAFALDPTVWYHVVATWDGRQSFLWVNGEPFGTSRQAEPPPRSDHPLILASAAPHGGGLVGGIEFVKIYTKALPPAEIIKRAYGIAPQGAAAPATGTVFDFTRGAGLQGWHVERGASATGADGRIAVSGTAPRTLFIHNALNACIDKKDFLSLRMTLDKGTRGEIVFVTSKGAGRTAFQTFADGKPHAYVFEPWTWSGWGGTLLALGIVPAEVQGATAQIDYLRVTEELQAEPEIAVASLFSESTLPRAQRPEKIVARVRNAGGPARRLQAALIAPEGVRVEGSRVQPMPALEYAGQQELAWTVRAPRPTRAEFRITVSGEGFAEVSQSQAVEFLPSIGLAKASYVPPPIPARGKYNLWTHYCPLWKHGTHYGWKLIEPWPERKPVLGWYNEGDPELADWHIKYWLEHGISSVVYCWYRSSINAPVVQNLGHAIHDGLLKAKYLPLIKFAIMWENGCGCGVGSAKDLMENVLPFWIDNYFSNPSYLRVDGKPLLYVWVPPNVTQHLGGSENVRKTLNAMRAECQRRGLGGLYLVGCVGGESREVIQAMREEGWDATSAYGSGWRQPAKVTTVGDFVAAPFEGFIGQQEQIWKFKRELGLLPDITAAMMGWDSRPWKETPFFWSDNTPAKFRELCLRTKAAVDAQKTASPAKDTAIFCCWNEFGEGHYIEPTRGYGFSYLDVVRDVFTDAPKEHVDLAPEDVGLGPYDSWYRAARQAAPADDVSRESSWSGQRLAAWTGMMGVDKTEVRDGLLRAATTNPDPAIASPALKLRASRLQRVIVEMRVSKPGAAQLFWSTATAPSTSEAASLAVTTRADGEFHSYAFEVATNEHWGGCVTSLRLDPAAAQGILVEIRSIRVQ